MERIKYVVESHGRDSKMLLVKYSTEVDSEDGNILEIASSMVEENSGLNWGYKGGGPHALTSMLTRRIFGDECVEDNKHYSKTYQNILTFVSEYNKDKEFEVDEDALLKMVSRTDIEGHKFDKLKNELEKLLSLALSNGFDTAKSLHLPLRINLPYTITIDNNYVSFSNREYLPLGKLYKCGDNDGTIKTKMTDATVEWLLSDAPANYDTKTTYLYDDSTTPWSSKADLVNYFVRLNSILSKLLGKELYPHFVNTNNLPTNKAAWQKIAR